MIKINDRVQIRGEVKGNSRPILNITVFNAIQGWNHDGYLTPKEAIGMAEYLRNWGEENLRAEDV